MRGDEDLDLAEFHLFDVREVLRGLQNNEQGVAVLLQLRALMSVERVLDDEVMQVDVQTDLFELGFGRLEQTGPTEGVLTAALAPICGVETTRLANAVEIERAVDDHCADCRTAALARVLLDHQSETPCRLPQENF